MRLLYYIALYNIIMITSLYASTAIAANKNKSTIQQFISSYKITILKDRKAIWLSGQSKRTLTLHDNLWQFEFNASLLTADINETALFTINQGMVQPHKYTHQSKGSIAGTHWIRFYYGSKPYFTHSDNTQKPIEFKPGMLDSASWITQLRLDLMHKKEHLRYSIINTSQQPIPIDFKISNYRDFVSTPIGTFNTIKVEKSIKNADDYIIVWLAPKWDYLVIRMVTSQYMLELTSAMITDKHKGKIIVKDNAQTTEKSLHNIKKND
jgi:hypothetical protein